MVSVSADLNDQRIIGIIIIVVVHIVVIMFSGWFKVGLNVEIRDSD